VSNDSSLERSQVGSVQTSGENNLPDRFTDPGDAPHRPRLADSDPKAAKRAERQVIGLFSISILGTILFIAAFFAVPTENLKLSNLLLGLGLGFGFFGVGAAAVHWAKTLMPDKLLYEERHPQRGSQEVRAEAVAMLQQGAEESGIARRPLLKGAFVTAVALAPLSLVVPLLGVGQDWNVEAFRHTAWRKGRRLAYDPSGRPIRAADVSVGSAVHVIPYGLDEEENFLEEKAKSVVLMVRLNPEDLKEEPERADWSYDGIVAYSKICTHVGCPVALYEHRTHHLLCPCHQSTFDVADGCKVVFGPAKRPLPQLPITVDDEGYLIAQSDFHEPIGASYWERERK